ncbi:unnamed protein product [Menidia menidia]|uniref:(Atlantic silverside) hypothetical protein n=1 Tax=Menidia menidia TaxID=238744 RepID=A0A8S4A614_9TELE|nr:unnamed protein product [Menidia menidia]
MPWHCFPFLVERVEREDMQKEEGVKPVATTSASYQLESSHSGVDVKANSASVQPIKPDKSLKPPGPVTIDSSSYYLLQVSLSCGLLSSASATSAALKFFSVFELCRGNQRELARQKHAKKQNEHGKGKRNEDGLSAAARKQRDAEIMQQKQKKANETGKAPTKQ